jgi:hypothetical protein
MGVDGGEKRAELREIRQLNGNVITVTVQAFVIIYFCLYNRAVFVIRDIG